MFTRSQDNRFSPADRDLTETSSSQPAREQESFADLVGDVQRLAPTNRVAPQRQRTKDPSLDYRRAAASREEQEVQDGLSSEILQLVESEEELIYASAGIQLKQMKKLKQGHIPWEEGLDLHGYTIDEARDQLSQFIRDAVRKEMRCVIVVHGKALSDDGKPPVIKSYLNDWLQQLPSAVAFCSAQPKDGGRGAVYVLLKRAR